MTHRLVIPLLASAAISIAACGDAAPAATAAEPVVRDSAGITIVENHAPLWAEGEGWRVSAEPVLEIGMIDGPEAYQLDRVTGAIRLPDGGIALANGGSREVRFYDAAGRFVRSVGRDGEGPGEYRIPVGVWPFGKDSLVVSDPSLRRATVYTLAGELGRTFPFEDAGFNPRPMGPFEDRTFLVFDEQFRSVEEGVVQQTGLFSLHSPDGALVDSVGRHPTFRTAPIVLPGGDSFVSAETFGARTAAALGSRHFFVGTASEPRVDAFSPEGRLERSIRWTDGDREVTAEHLARHRDARVAAATSADAERRVRHQLDATPSADRFPAYQELRADRADRLWVQQYDRPGDSGPGRWLVFDADGRMLGSVEVPRGRIFDIGPDYLLGVFRDDFDVEYVRMYDLFKPEGR
jgi:hypothetical protein